MKKNILVKYSEHSIFSYLQVDNLFNIYKTIKFLKNFLKAKKENLTKHKKLK